jgi:hypothetical protein
MEGPLMEGPLMEGPLMEGPGPCKSEYTGLEGS